MCRGTPGLLMIALPADLRASIPEVCPLSGQVDSPDLRLRGEREHGEARAGRRLRRSGKSRSVEGRTGVS